MSLFRVIIVFIISLSLLLSALPFEMINFVVQSDIFRASIVRDAKALSCSPCRRAARELRRARDRIRAELERARQRAERETRRASKRVEAEAKRVTLEHLENQASQVLSNVGSGISNVASNVSGFAVSYALSYALNYLPVGIIVNLAIQSLEYERYMQDLIALDENTTNPSQSVLDARTTVDQMRLRLQQSESVLESLENLSVPPSTLAQVSHVRDAPTDVVQSANVARLKHEQLGQYMGTLLIQGLAYQGQYGAVPPQRPITLIYKIGQALIDYAHLKADVRLISESQPEHSGLYAQLITNGGLESVVMFLTNGLQYLETMPISNEVPPPISPNSQVAREIALLDALSADADQVLADHYAFPLVDAPTALIARMNVKLASTDFNQSNLAMSWLLLRPQHEIDSFDVARGRLEQSRDQLVEMQILTPDQLVGRFFFEALILAPRVDAARAALAQGVPTAIAAEVLEIHQKLERANNLVISRGIQLPVLIGNYVGDALRNLMTAYTEITAEMDLLLAGSSTPVSPSVPASPPTLPVAPITPNAPVVPVSPVQPSPSSTASSSISLPGALIGSAPLLPSPPPAVVAQQQQAIVQTLTQVQQASVQKVQQISASLSRKDYSAVGNLINPDTQAIQRTQDISRAVAAVSQGKSKAPVQSLQAALNQQKTLERVSNKDKAFTDSRQLGIHKDAVETLYSVGLINGYPDGSFRADKELNRAEMLTLAVKAAYGKEFEAFKRAGGYQGTAQCFSDVPRGEWFEDAVCFGAQQGVIQGYLDGTFQPAKPVNFVEGLRLTIASFRLPVVAGGAQWFSNDIDYARLNNMIPGDFSRNDSPLARGQMASMLSRAVVLSQSSVSHPVIAADAQKSDAEKILSVWDTRVPVKPVVAIDLEKQRLERIAKVAEEKTVLPGESSEERLVNDKRVEKEHGTADKVLDSLSPKKPTVNPQKPGSLESVKDDPVTPEVKKDEVQVKPEAVRISQALREFRGLLGQMKVTVSLFGKSPTNVGLLKEARRLSDQAEISGLSEKRIMSFKDELQGLINRMVKEKDPSRFSDVDIRSIFEGGVIQNQFPANEGFDKVVQDDDVKKDDGMKNPSDSTVDKESSFIQEKKPVEEKVEEGVKEDVKITPEVITEKVNPVLVPEIVPVDAGLEYFMKSQHEKREEERRAFDLLKEKGIVTPPTESVSDSSAALKELEFQKQSEAEKLKKAQNEEQERKGLNEEQEKSADLQLQSVGLLSEFDLLYLRFIQSLKIDSYLILMQGKNLYRLAHLSGVFDASLKLYLVKLQSLISYLQSGKSGYIDVLSDLTPSVKGVRIVKDRRKLLLERKLRRQRGGVLSR